MKSLNVLLHQSRFCPSCIHVLILLLTLLLVECGGGGGSGIEKSCSPSPQILSTPPTQATVQQPYIYYIGAKYECLWGIGICSDVKVLNMPAGAYFSNYSQYISWTPSLSQAYSNVPFSIATLPDDCGNSATQSWTVHVLPDTTPPTVSSVYPANGSTGVPLNSTISASFSEPIDFQTVTTSSILVSSPFGYIDGIVQTSGNKVNFTPIEKLPYSNLITVTITTAVKDLSGNALASNYTWTFTTAAQDTTLPTVTSTSPISNATGVAINTAITATFSETMTASTINAATFTVNNGVTGTVTYSGTTATFTPSSNLAYSTAYTTTITTGVTDSAGNAMAAAYAWTFTTGAAGANFKMPDTGQTTCYNASGAVISCVGVGQDGAYTINPPTYTDNGNGTITDNVTNLVWQKRDDATARSWGNATTYCSNISLAGQTGWRLPSQIELVSIVDYGVYNPSINATYFPGTSSAYYWSSTMSAYNNYNYVEIVNFSSGFTDFTGGVIGSCYVRCVRGGN